MAKNISVILTLQDKFTKKMSLANYETLKFKRNLAVAQYTSDKFAGVMHTMESAISKSALITGSAGAMLAKSSLDVFAQFDESMRNVAGVKSIDALGQEFKDLTKMAKDASNAVGGTTYKDAADTLYYMSLAGWNTVQSQKALVPILKAVRINGGDTKETADAITDSMTALGLASDDAGEYIDKCAVIQANSNTNMLQLNDALISCGSLMKNLGIETKDANGNISSTVSDTMTLIGALSSAGKKSDEAGTAVRSLYQRFVKDTAEAQAGLDQIGLSVYTDTGEMKSIPVLLEEMSGKLKKLNNQERNSALSKIGGRFANDLTVAMDAFTVVGEDGKTAYQKMKDALEDYGGASDRYLNAINNGWSGTVAKMSAEWFNFRAEVGETIAPYAIEAMDYIMDKMPSIEEWLKNKLPSVLEKGKEVVLDIKDALVEMKPVMDWLLEHWKGIATVAGTAYVGMGAFRLGTGGMEAYDTYKKIQKGVAKQKATEVTVPGLKLSDLSPVTGNTSYATGYVAKGVTSQVASPVAGMASKASTALVPVEIVKTEGFGVSSLTPSIGNTSYEIANAAKGVSGNVASTALVPVGSVAGSTALTGATSAAGASGAVGSVGGALAGIAGPLAVVAAVVATFALAYKNSERLRKSIKNLGGGIKDSLGDTLNNIKNGLKNGLESAQPFIDVCKVGFKEMGDTLAIFTNILGPVVEGFIDIAGLGLGGILEGIGSAFGAIGTALDYISKTPLAEFFRNCTEYLADLSEEFREFIGLIQDDEPSSPGEYTPIAYKSDHSMINGTVTKQNNPSGGVNDEESGGTGSDEKGIELVETPTGWKPVRKSESTIGDIKYTEKSKEIIKKSDAYSPEEKVKLAKEGKLLIGPEVKEHKALGTNYWKGGRTYVNEHGGEIMDLPRGTRIIPADKSEKMANAVNKGVTVIVNIENMYGEDEAYVDRIGDKVAHKLASVM